MSVKKYKKHKGYESLNREFLQRNDLSLEARGLLAYMESMPDDYVFHKTNLYKCFEKNKKTSVERIWNELLDNHFIIAFSKGKAPKQEFEYLFTHEGFSELEVEQINKEYLSQNWEIAYRTGTNRKPASYYQKQAKNTQNTENETPQESSKYQGVENQHPDNHGISAGVDFEQHNLNSSKSTGNKFTNKGLLINGEDEEDNNKEISKFQNQVEKTKADYLECFPFEKELIQSLMKTKFPEAVKAELMDFLFITRVGFDLDYSDSTQASIAFAQVVQEQLLDNKINSNQNYLSYFRIGLQQKIATRKAVSSVHY
jgi:hypothetical protein